MNANDDPLSFREGMIGEVLETAEVYPYLVVVTNAESVGALQQSLAARCEQECEVLDDRLRLPRCDIAFVSERECEKYRGTVPVFYDPNSVRKAA